MQTQRRRSVSENASTAAIERGR